MKKNEIIFGTRVVIEALRAGCRIEKIFVQQTLGASLVKELIAGARALHVPVSFVPRQKLDHLTSTNHQGVVAVRAVVHYAQLEDIIHQSYDEGKDPFFLLLDRVTDVGNFGAIARTVECAGLNAIVVEHKGRALLTGDAVRASAGALSHIPVCRTDAMPNAIKCLQENGLKVVACTEKSTTALYDIDMRGPLALLLGSEEKGIAPSLCKAADELVKIPMYGNMQSLNVSAAAAIAIYEAIRQKRQPKHKEYSKRK